MSDSEEGFTLIELLIVVVVLAIIIGTMAGAMIVGIRTTNATIQRLSESHDAQNSAAYFVSDMQSAVTTTVGSHNGCGSPPSPLVSFEWTDYLGVDSTDAKERIATYATGSEDQVVEDETGELIQRAVTIVRHFCTKTGGSPSVEETTRIASLVSLTSLPEVACHPDPPGCSSTTPEIVEIAATEASGFEFRLSARRRSAIP